MEKEKLVSVVRDVVAKSNPDQLALYDLEGVELVDAFWRGKKLDRTYKSQLQARFGIDPATITNLAGVAGMMAAYIGVIASTVAVIKDLGFTKKTVSPEDVTEFQLKWSIKLQENGIAKHEADLLASSMSLDVIQKVNS